MFSLQSDARVAGASEQSLLTWRGTGDWIYWIATVLDFWRLLFRADCAGVSELQLASKLTSNPWL